MKKYSVPALCLLCEAFSRMGLIARAVIVSAALATLMQTAWAESGIAVISCEDVGNTSVRSNGCRVCIVSSSGTVCDKDANYRPTGRVPVAPADALVTGVYVNSTPATFNLLGYALTLQHDGRQALIAVQADGHPPAYATQQDPVRTFNGQLVEADGGRWLTSIRPLMANPLMGWILFYSYTITWSTPPQSNLSSVSAASFSSTLLAPNTIVAAFGTGLATQTAAATARPLPTALGGTRVDIISGGQTTPAPLFFVSPTQVNYLLPANIPSGMAMVRIISGGGQTAEGTINVATVAPGLFTANSNGMGVVSGVAVRVAANGAQTTEAIAQFDQAQGRFNATPINLGPEGEQIVLVLFGTGIRHRSALSAVTVTIGGTNVPVEFAGAQGVFDGLDQVNVRLPRSLIGRGEVQLVLTVDGRTANTARVSIR